MISLRLTEQMFEILQLHLEGLSAYKIARKLNLDPPTVYASLKAAEKNFVQARLWIRELEAKGFPDSLASVKGLIRSKGARMARTEKVEEIALKLG